MQLEIPVSKKIIPNAMMTGKELIPFVSFKGPDTDITVYLKLNFMKCRNYMDSVLGTTVAVNVSCWSCECIQHCAFLVYIIVCIHGGIT